MVYASPTMIAPRFRSKATLAWMIALALVAAGGQWAHGLIAQQRPAPRAPDGARPNDTAALDTIQIRQNVWVIFGAVLMTSVRRSGACPDSTR